MNRVEIKKTDKLSIAMAQLNPHLGNVGANKEKLISAHKKAARTVAFLIPARPSPALARPDPGPALAWPGPGPGPRLFY